MILPRFAVTQCGCMDEEYLCSENYSFETIISDYFTDRLSHIPPLQVLEVHLNGIRGITIHIIEPKIHISYSKNHDLTLFL